MPAAIDLGLGVFRMIVEEEQLMAVHVGAAEGGFVEILFDDGTTRRFAAAATDPDVATAAYLTLAARLGALARPTVLH